MDKDICKSEKDGYNHFRPVAIKKEPVEGDTKGEPQLNGTVNGGGNNKLANCSKATFPQEQDNHPKHYRIFGKDSMKLFAQSVPVDDNVLLLLSEDVVYRLRELVTNSYQFTKHGKRVKLTCDDINKALHHSDSPKIFGYGQDKKPLKEVYCEEAGVWAVKNQPIDLMACTESIIDKTYRLDLNSECPQYRIEWLSQEVKVKREYEQPGSHEHAKFMSAFNCISQGLLSKDSSLFNSTLEGLSSISNIQHILPFLIKFMTGKIIKGSDIKVIRQLLLAIRALCRNQCIQITSEVYTVPLVNSVLHCILSYSCDANSNGSITGYDHWNLREFAAGILADMIKNCSSSFVYNNVYNQVIRALLECIKDPARSYASYYGCIVAFSRLGFDCVMNHFYPHFSNVFNHLYHSIESDIFISDHARESAHAAMGALSSLGKFLILKIREKLLNNEACDYGHVVKEMLAIFGDQVAIQLPTDIDGLIWKIYSSKKTAKPSDLQSQPSGFELLDAFYENTRANNQDEDDSSSVSVDSKDDEKSNESEKDLICNDGADLLVQSTISDPTLGVKLTIKKIRRPRRSTDELSEAHKRKKKKAKITRDFMASFNEEFESLLVAEARLKGIPKCNRISKKATPEPFEPSPWYSLARRMRIVSKLSKRTLKVRADQWKRKMYSASTKVIL